MQTGKVNQRILSFMEKRDMDIQALSEAAGLDPQFIKTMLEEDAYPPLGPLMKIARALGVRLGTFLDDQDSSDPYIVRKAEREGGFSVLDSTNKAPTLNFYALGKGKSDRHMEPFFVEILPESAKKKTLSSHEGEEFIVVVSGLVEVIYGNKTYELKPGDSIYYNSVVPHYVSCIGKEKAEIHAVVYVPE
ncbi:DNA-binding protein [Desulfobacter hydrogenophilus]|uniref:Cupin domain-containing protein n=1 Tax=Desulfobacter hydrogenophilus TaxID=2291 RepID=A0A328FGJ5_9BACT|nr:cupin domain-containing protein [Desulfobacter hydrogenophilus]NDY71535.1 cupin domain-containing protein [Desulfobacter hydrogenophilus]QBH11919.1 cupin domain-containing protein [Desulfobacter hydrogenophilus]RAM02592.1 DNA-binding protein [Desulfobacter hydrogenophilus]